METPLEFTQDERRCTFALKLEQYLISRIDGLRKQNDGDRNWDETAKLRGRIAELKILRELMAKESAVLRE